MTRVLALDLGSSSVRGVVCDERAEPVPGALARREVTPSQDDSGRGELDPEAYVASLVECLDELRAAGVLAGVSAVACSSQWHSVLALDPEGRPLTGALTWLDTRARNGRRPADPAAFHTRTGSYVHPLYWTAKLPFLRERLGRDRIRFVGLPDYVRGVLLGDDATSVSVASGTGLLNLATCDWDDEALELAGVRPDRLPVISMAPGRLAAPWRDRWPELADVAWHPALGDGAASNLGSGCASPDLVAITLGTSMALRVVHPSASAGEPAGDRLPWEVWRYRVDEKTLVSGIAYSGGGVLHARTVELLGLPRDFDPEKIAPGAAGLLVVPLHAGSRPPGTRPPGSGVVSGLSLDTTAEELLAGTMDGVALEAALGLADLEQMFGGRLDVVLGGGAAHASAYWRRSFAAALERPLLLADDAEVGARGAAAHALGLTLTRPETILRPDACDLARMATIRERYERLRRVLSQVDEVS